MRGGTAALRADLLGPELLGRFEGEDGVALLDALQVVLVVAEGAVEPVKVHLRQGDLSGDGLDRVRRGRTGNANTEQPSAVHCYMAKCL